MWMHHSSGEDLSLDGFYIEWTEKLSNQHSSAFQKLCPSALQVESTNRDESIRE